MLEKGIISTRQFIFMLYIIITSFTALHVPGLLIQQAGRDAWLSVLGGWYLDVLLAIVYAYLGVRFPGENFVQYSITILGKYLGRLVGVCFPLFFLLVCALLLRGLSHLIHSSFLPQTPFEVIMISGSLIVAIGARKGIEVIGRVSEILGPIYFFSIVLLVILVLPSSQPHKLPPQLEQGTSPFLVGAPFCLTFFGICIMMAMFIPVNNKIENGYIAKFTAVSMGAFIVGSIILLSIMLFGYDYAKHMANPGLGLTRMIYVGRFLERLEVIWMMIAIGAALVGSCMMIWAFSLGISQLLLLKSYKPLVFPGTLLSTVLGLVAFDHYSEHIEFIHYTFPVIAVIVESGLIFLLFFTAIILKKKGSAL